MNTQFIHPALSIQNNILTLGFQVKEYNFEEKKWETKNRYLKATFEEHTKIVDVQIINENEFEGGKERLGCCFPSAYYSIQWFHESDDILSQFL